MGQAQTERDKLCVDTQLILKSQQNKISFLICNTVSTLAPFVQRLLSTVPGPHICHLRLIYVKNFG
jgi:hypothetical protein